MPNQNITYQNPFEQPQPQSLPRAPIINRRRSRLGQLTLGYNFGLGKRLSRSSISVEHLAERITLQDRPTNEEVEQLKSIFIFREPSSVYEFLNDNLFLTNLLIEASLRIREQFGSDTSIVIKILRDSESDDSRELFLVIQTTLSVQESLNKLDYLDQEWWLDALPRARGQMNIGLEYI